MANQEKEEFRTQLANRQQTIKNAGLPVVVILEGWGAAGKGSALGSIIKYMDPRFFRTYNMDARSSEDDRYPFLHRYQVKLPAKGQFAFFDGSWMDELTYGYLRGEVSEEKYQNTIESIKHYERQLADNGYLVIKFFFEIDEKTQTERLKALESKSTTKYRVSKKDSWQNKHYKKCQKVYNEYIAATDTALCPWYIIKATDKDDVERYVANTIIRKIDQALSTPVTPKITDSGYPLVKTQKLSKVKLEGKELTDEEYKKKLKKLQKELRKLHNKLYLKKIPVIIAYEGWDAAGKGGNIKRIAGALDPRGYEVHPIASPTPDEKNRHFLWRFWTRLPKTGHIAIFDRTWYGRVMVERLEGFCSENDWKRAYNEINEFEKDLTDWGAIVIKFWVQIDNETQLARFTDRQNTPEKQWKITDEDWRNRDKWDLYEKAVDEMIKKTSTEYAPWHILESNDKKYARIKALETVIAEIKKRV